MASAGAKCCSGKCYTIRLRARCTIVRQCSPTNVSETKAESLLVRQCTKTAEIISSSDQLSAGRVEEDSRSGAIVASSPILATLLSAGYRENEGGG